MHVFASITVSVTGKVILKTRDAGSSTHSRHPSLNNHFLNQIFLKVMVWTVDVQIQNKVIELHTFYGNVISLMNSENHKMTKYVKSHFLVWNVVFQVRNKINFIEIRRK